MAANKGVLGLVVVGPSADDAGTVDRRSGGLPLLAFVSSQSPETRQSWLAFRDQVGLPWTAIHINVAAEALAQPDEHIRSTIASHIGGFAREIAALTSRKLSG